MLYEGVGRAVGVELVTKSRLILYAAEVHQFIFVPVDVLVAGVTIEDRDGVVGS